MKLSDLIESIHGPGCELGGLATETTPTVSTDAEGMSRLSVQAPGLRANTDKELSTDG